MEKSNLISDSNSNSESKKSWNTKDEMALKVGVLKYGVGNWKSIQEDLELNKYLNSRSDVELQEKWQNMNVEASMPQPAIQDQLNVEFNQIAECKQSPKGKMSDVESEAVVDAEAESKAEDKIEAEAETEAEADAEEESEAEAEAKTEAEVSEDPQFRHCVRSRSNIDLKEKKQNMKTEVSMPKPAIQDQKSSEVAVVAEAGARFKIETEKDLFSSLKVIDRDQITGLIADLEKNDPEHAGYCKHLQKLLEYEEKADEILACANEIMNRPLEDDESSD